MNNFLKLLKEYMLKLKEQHPELDIITYYESIDQNKEKEYLKEVIDDCENNLFTFEYTKDKDAWDEGVIKINFFDKGISYLIRLLPLNNGVNITKDLGIYSYKEISKEKKEAWERELLNLKIQQLKNNIHSEEDHIENEKNKLENMNKQLKELEKSASN